MSRVYDQNQPVRLTAPIAVAQMRADRFEDPIDRAAFMDAFGKARVAAARGKDLYLWFRAALDNDESATVAGLIEGAASVRNERTVS